MSKIFSGTYAAGITLTSASYGPATITATGRLQGGLAVNSPDSWQILNRGTVQGSAFGIYLSSGGTITNASGGSIGGRLGISGGIGGALTVINDGLIASPAAGVAITLRAGGSVTNQSGGTIAGHGGIYGGVYQGTGTALTVVNAGSIRAANAYGVVLYEGGSVTNPGGATISANYTAVYSGPTGALNLVNAGLIEARLSFFVSGVYARGGGGITNQAGGTIAGYNGVGGSGALLTIVNAGVIGGSTTGPGAGMRLNVGGSVNNQSSGTITGSGGVFGGRYGVAGAALTVVNAGRIAATGARGIALYDGGSVTNLGGGRILAQANAIYSDRSGALTVVNDGRIEAQSGFGIAARAGGSVTNRAGGTISGHDGIGAAGGALTVVNAGSIVANAPSAAAVRFANGYANLLTIDPGAVFAGTVDGGNTIGSTSVSTLELASGTGTLSGIGSQFVNFVQTTIDGGGSWNLTGTNTLIAGTTLTNAGTLVFRHASLSDAGLLIDNGSILIDASTVTLNDLTGTGTIEIGAGGTLDIFGTIGAGETIGFGGDSGFLTFDPTRFDGRIRDFHAGNTINLAGVTDASSAGIVNGNTLEILRTGHAAIDLTLTGPSASWGSIFSVVAASVVVSSDDPACFLRGTLIRTERGEIPVELLAAGDRAVTLSGRVRPIRWIGHRTIDLKRHPAPDRVQPIRIRANAFADGAPKRDLLLSPEHAVLYDGVLVPVRLLVNGASILPDLGHRQITYYHVELETHDILLAENLAAESYLETGNRGLFENAGEPFLLHPDLTNDQDRRQSESCAPFVDDPARTEPIWRALAVRAERLGLPLPRPAETTDDPALCLLVDGRQLAPISVIGGKHVFVVPAGAAEMRLLSRSARPSEAAPWVSDDRRLGVLLRGLTVRSGVDVVSIPLDHPGFGEGWWQAEWHGPNALRRWTDGDALLPAPEATAAPCLLEVEVAATMNYRLATYNLADATSGQTTIRCAA